MSPAARGGSVRRTAGPGLTLSGGDWPEGFSNGTPFYAVLPDDPHYPYRGRRGRSTLRAAPLAKRAGAEVLATASPRSAERVRAAGAHQVIDHTATSVAEAVTDPVDVLLNLAPVAPHELAALTALLRPEGIVLSTTTPTAGDDSRRVRGVDVSVRSDAGQLAQLVALVDAGELRVDVAERVPLAQLRTVHARAPTGSLPGKVVLLPAA